MTKETVNAQLGKHVYHSYHLLPNSASTSGVETESFDDTRKAFEILVLY